MDKSIRHRDKGQARRKLNPYLHVKLLVGKTNVEYSAKSKGGVCILGGDCEGYLFSRSWTPVVDTGMDGNIAGRPCNPINRTTLHEPDFDGFIQLADILLRGSRCDDDGTCPPGNQTSRVINFE